jgi:UDP-N-acetylglucosamine acyltransferase
VIHPTALVHPQAKLAPGVVIGPYAIVDAGVEVGPDCIIGPQVHLTGLTVIGGGNRFMTGAVIGEAPQDLKYSGTPTRLRIGNGNVFREHVTVHRSTNPDSETVIGSGNFLMANAHVGHNCTVGNHVIIANGALLGGHVEIGDRAFISGNCLLHQFVRVGTLALMQGGSGISQDLPPFAVARGDNGMAGLNFVGLRRAGICAADRGELKRLYHLLFMSRLPLRTALKEAEAKFTSSLCQTVTRFVALSKRGICSHRSLRTNED